MKKNKLLLSSILLTGAMLLSASLYFNNKAKYSPRVSEKPESRDEKEDAEGMARWLFNMRKNPLTGKIDPLDVIKVREDVMRMVKSKSPNTALGLDWKELGPDNVGGRTRAILIDKNNPTKIFAGSVGGGLWVSTNSGSSWQGVAGFDQQPNLVISCITQATNGDIYVGTGEGFMGMGGSFGTSTIGNGIYKSTDDGATFNLLASTIPTTSNTTNATANTAFISVYNLAASPTNPNLIYAATDYGLQVTLDGGLTWSHPVNTTYCLDIDVANDGTVMAVIGTNIYQSTDGTTFNLLNPVGFPTSYKGRIELAISPTDPNYMYASISSILSTANSFSSGETMNGHLLGIYQSTDKGATWKTIANGGSSLFDPLGKQGTYANTIAVFPSDKTQIVVGGLDNWVWKQTNPSTPGVGQWIQATFWAVRYPGFTHYVHADIHTIKFNPTNPNIVYIGCDGGIFRSINGGQDFTMINNNYNITQFYSIAFESDANKGFMGGSQDNGTQYVSGHGNSTKFAEEIQSGDGFQCEVSFLNPNVSYTSAYFSQVERHSSKGGAGNNMYSKNVTDFLGSSPSYNKAGFVTPMALYETKNSTNSPDTIKFYNGLTIQIGATGNGINKHFTGYTHLPQASATLVPGTITIKTGTQTVTDDGAGLMTGNIDVNMPHTFDYSTGYYDFYYATPPANGNVMNITFKVMYAIGANILIDRSNYVYPLNYTTTSVVNYGDTVKIYDPFQAKLAVGFNGYVYMTKQALDFSSTPLWLKIGTVTGTVEQLAWSADGDVLFASTDAGNLYRFSNLAKIVDSLTGDVGLSTKLNPKCIVKKDLIESFGFNVITGISVDQNNANNVAVSIGGYGVAVHVKYSTNALAALTLTTPTFSSVQGTGLPAMPVYSVMLEKLDPHRAFIGTDYGVYSTNDITAGSGVVWSPENGVTNLLPNVMVSKLRQQQLPETSVYNAYVIYAATFGRGAWKSDKYFISPSVGINEHTNPKSSSLESGLLIYPNPMTEEGTVSFTLNSSTEIEVSVFNLQGKLVKSIKPGKLNAGLQKIQLNTDELSKGTYLLSIDGTNCHATSRFVVVK